MKWNLALFFLIGMMGVIPTGEAFANNVTNQEAEAFNEFDLNMLEIQFTDEDTDSDEIAGTVSFRVNILNDNRPDTELVKKYEVGFYFWGEETNLYEEVVVGEILPADNETYTIKIPENTIIPEHAKAIGIRAVYIPGAIPSGGGFRVSSGSEIKFFDFATALDSVVNEKLDVFEELFVHYYTGSNNYHINVYSKHYNPEAPYDVLLNFEYHEDDANMAAFYYLNSEGAKIGTIGQIRNISNPIGSSFSFWNFPAIPDGAVAIGVFAKNKQGESSNYIALPLTQNHENLVTGSFLDEDLESGKIGGTLTWDKVDDEHLYRKYSVYLMEKNNDFPYSVNLPKIKLGEVPATGQDSYAFNIARGTVFGENDYLIILPEIEGFYYTSSRNILTGIDQNEETVKAITLSEESIHLTKDSGQIALSIKDLHTQNTVNVYKDLNGDVLLGQFTGNAFKFAPIGLNKVYVSVTNTYGNESNIIEVDLSGYNNGLFQDAENDWYYLKEGTALKGWVQDTDKAWYFFDQEGKRKSSWIYSSGSWYYLDNDHGKMLSGWIKDGTDWYYLAKTGAMQTGWIKDGTSWYYLAASGKMVTGWTKINGTWYYMESSGAMKTGWLASGSTWYYLKSSGAMATGWQDLGGIWYFFYNDGRMAANTVIGGYTFNSSGAWVK
ncbi:hypothetical protein LC085_10035 [Bacillus tianshenii]|uniref:N-acetylmuramoyl-L-alanine amidase family protein n=1 Tax=Sutcliffiella tianshenii TaxID=1463404 RepID=UPI001CD33825|nr:N-acetylmuramoyl-L-alanine amidase family protein [Bacillus tianshenii]MCA1320245.1 hypothetical protein [Bacillus tianshenii]